MSVDQGIGLAGIIATLAVAVFAGKKISNSQKGRQNQNVKNGKAYQAGRDMKIDKDD